jgi:ADP-heptose:LPS heptosyltransferase
MVDRQSYEEWLAFLDTVRTERFEHVLAMKEQITSHLAA